ncbi:hypothetical protein [Kaarinaea lacus]
MSDRRKYRPKPYISGIFNGFASGYFRRFQVDFLALSLVDLQVAPRRNSLNNK